MNDLLLVYVYGISKNVMKYHRYVLQLFLTRRCGVSCGNSPRTHCHLLTTVIITIATEASGFSRYINYWLGKLEGVQITHIPRRETLVNYG